MARNPLILFIFNSGGAWDRTGVCARSGAAFPLSRKYFVYLYLRKNKYAKICKKLQKPLQIHANMQTYVNALRKSGGRGFSTRNRRTTHLAVNSPSHTRARGWFKAERGMPAWRLIFPGPLSSHAARPPAARRASAVNCTVHHMMPSAASGLSYRFAKA